MNTTHDTPHPHGPGALLASMVHTRLELAAMDLEAHLAASARAMVIGAAAAVISMVAFAFIGLTVIALFWNTHRALAVLGTTCAYTLLAALLGWLAHRYWKARPPAFEAVLHELERDRAALRGHP